MAPKKKVKLFNQGEDSYFTESFRSKNLTPLVSQEDDGISEDSEKAPENIPAGSSSVSEIGESSYSRYPDDTPQNAPFVGSHHYKASSQESSYHSLDLPGPSGQGSSRGPQPKKKQKCRLCANHNLEVDMKGHRHYCPYSACECGECEITKMRQLYMRKQQQITRRQQQQQQQQQQLHLQYQQGGTSQEGINFGQPLDMSMTSQESTFEREFPPSRREEMEKDLASIDDQTLLEKIDELCRSRGGRKH